MPGKQSEDLPRTCRTYCRRRSDLRPSATSNRGSVMLLPLGAMHKETSRLLNFHVQTGETRREMTDGGHRRTNRMSEKRLLGKRREDAVLVTAWNVTTFTREMIREWRLCDIGGPKAGEGNKGSSDSDSAKCGRWHKRWDWGRWDRSRYLERGFWLQKCFSVVVLRLWLDVISK
jgi:hypothetical protein